MSGIEIKNSENVNLENNLCVGAGILSDGNSNLNIKGNKVIIPSAGSSEKKTFWSLLGRVALLSKGISLIQRAFLWLKSIF